MIIDQPVVSGSLNVTGSSTFVGNIVVTGSVRATDGISISGSSNLTGSLTVTNQIIAQTLNVQQVTSSIVYSSGSNVFGNQLTDTQQFTGSVTVTGSLKVNNSDVILTNQTSSITVLSSSFASTASYVQNAQSASVAVSSSYALTASYSANVPVTSSYALQALSASYAQTSSYSLSGTGFPFSGSAIITGSLLITNLSGSGIRYVVTDENGLITAQTASTVLKTTQTYTASAGQTTFSVTNGYSTGYVDVFINGSKLNNTEFTDTSGTNVVLATGSFANDIVEVVKYLPASGVSNNVLRTLTTFTAAASQSTFNVGYTPGLIDIFYNGSRLSPVEYTANNGTSFTLVTASNAGDTLDVLVYSYQVGAYSGIGGSGQLNQVSFYTTTSSISGSDNFTFDGSTLRVTGSIITSGSSTFVNIGPTILSGSVAISGSLTVTQGVTISGSIASASYAANAELLDNLDSTAFVFTSSFNTYSSSMSSRTTTLEAASASLNTASGSFSTRVTKIEGNYATTGSNIFTGAQTVCANITSTGTIIAQTLNVQQVTSSIVYSSGSNIFGCSLTNTQQFTGSVTITGSLNVAGNTCVVSICSPAHVGGTFSGTTGTFTGDVSINSTNSKTGGTAWNLNVRDTTAMAANVGGGISFQGLYTAGGAIGNFGAIAGYKTNATTGNESGGLRFYYSANGVITQGLQISETGAACFACELTAKTLGTNDLILNNLNYECANYVDGTRGSWLIQEGACDLFIINQVSGKKYKFNLIEIK